MGASVAWLALPACGEAKKDASLKLKTRSLPVEMTPEEFKLLENPVERKRAMGDAPLTFTGKLLGPPHRLDNASLADVQFVDCDFLGQYMFKVNLTNVSFTRCAIVGVRWEDGDWNDVSFTECVVRGRGTNIIGGGGKSKMSYDKCQFFGGEPQTPDDIDDLELHGGVGATGKSRFVNCEFTRMQVRLIGKSEFKNCKFLSVRIEPARSKVPIESLSIEDSNGTYSLDLGNRGIDSLTLKNGSFHRIDLASVRSKDVTLENISGNVKITHMEALKFSASNCTFKAATNDLDKARVGGLVGRLTTIDSFTLVNCKFDGPKARLTLDGAPPELDKRGQIVPRFTEDKKPFSYFSELGTVTLRNTPLLAPNFNYSHIKQLVLEDTSMGDATIAHAEIGKLTLKNAKLMGSLDLTGTKVKEVFSESVTKESLVITRGKGQDEIKL